MWHQYVQTDVPRACGVRDEVCVCVSAGPEGVDCVCFFYLFVKEYFYELLAGHSMIEKGMERDGRWNK